MSSWVSERASERMSVAERASEASSAEQAIEWAVRGNERTEERMTQYSMRRLHIIWPHCDSVSVQFSFCFRQKISSVKQSYESVMAQIVSAKMDKLAQLDESLDAVQTGLVHNIRYE